MYDINYLKSFSGKRTKSSSFTIHSAEDVIIPGCFGDSLMRMPRKLITTGMEITVEEGYSIIIVGRNGLASNHGLFLMSDIILTPECFGELKVVLCNLGVKSFEITKGNIIADARRPG